ncbi:hypothetical protein [Pseudomonas sp. nanlin1]|uniref:hypothetical protein n=1 Tax=Pseudomonas sp. nanlin1 TaxID=3040605 RepID=UPI00388D0A39
MIDHSRLIRECAGLYRLGRDVQAGLMMVDICEGVSPLFEGVAGAQQAQWTSLLVQMLECQQRQDTLGLADYLEYELIELLDRQTAQEKKPD